MIKWELSDSEFDALRSTLNRELSRLKSVASMNRSPVSKTQAEGKGLVVKRLLSSLEKTRALTELGVDVFCYCDTNYDFYTSTLAVSYRIGEDSPIQREVVNNMPPPPDEFLGIMAVLQALKTQGVKGRVQVITDASRCALALQMGLRYRIPNHSENQSPRSGNFGHTYDAALALTKDLLNDGCHVEYSFRNRGFINDALNLAR